LTLDEARNNTNIYGPYNESAFKTKLSEFIADMENSDSEIERITVCKSNESISIAQSKNHSQSSEEYNTHHIASVTKETYGRSFWYIRINVDIENLVIFDESSIPSRTLKATENRFHRFTGESEAVPSVSRILASGYTFTRGCLPALLKRGIGVKTTPKRARVTAV